MSKYHILAIIQDDVRLPERRLIQVFRAQGLSHFIYGIIHLGPKTSPCGSAYFYVFKFNIEML